jgi:hypothetical protein
VGLAVSDLHEAPTNEDRPAAAGRSWLRPDGVERGS